MIKVNYNFYNIFFKASSGFGSDTGSGAGLAFPGSEEEEASEAEESIVAEEEDVVAEEEE